MTAKDLLDRLEHLFAKKESWIQGAFAQDKNGAYCSPERKEAVCWCIQGGVRKLDPAGFIFSPAFRETSDLLARAAQARGFKTEIGMNDHPDTTHADLIDLIREAKELLQLEQVPA